VKCPSHLLGVWRFPMANVTIFGLDDFLLDQLSSQSLFQVEIILLFLPLIHGLALIGFCYQTSGKSFTLKFHKIIIPVTLFFLNLSWTSLHAAHSVILTLKQYHICFFECDYVMEFWKRVAWLIFSAYYKLILLRLLMCCF